MSGDLLLYLPSIYDKIPEKSLPEDIYLEKQIIDVLNQYAAENSGYQINEKHWSRSMKMQTPMTLS